MFPVEERVSDIRRALDANRDVVLTAPPGSGKTTCVPPALLDAPWLAGKKIVMLEPRRLAARNCAQFIARKRGEPLGETIGYQVRLERKVSSRTRLEIVTEGLLVQRILADPELKDVGLLIFDEFHERALPCDLAFALALDVRRALRPDLRLLVMSATLDADEVAAHLGDAEIIRAEGRMFPVRTEYLGDISMSAAIAKASATTEGDILCFLPGEGEIRKVIGNREQGIGKDFEILPLYGALPKDEQDRVFAESPRRKVILATSIAETSVTIPGVTCVIDSGLMRVPRFSPCSGMTGLVTLPLTRDRAEQRRGRAGRVRPGVCYRLWTAESDASRPAKMMPEMLDADLAALVLSSAAWGALQREGLPWLTPPPASAWDQAVQLLKRLGALDVAGRLTEKGERMSHLPMHPRLANMILGGGDPMLAAIIEEGSKSRETDIRYVPRSPRITELARRFAHYAQSTKHEAQSTKHEAQSTKHQAPGPSLSLAYPDRIARNRGNGTFRMVSGRGAFLPEDDPLAKEPYLVCCELDDRPGDAKVFLGCPIDVREIEALFGDQIVEQAYCAWDRPTDRVKAVVRRMLGAMVLDEKPCQLTTSNQQRATAIAEAMLAGIRQKGIENLPCWTKDSLQLRARMAFMAKHVEGWPMPTDEAILAVLPAFLSGMTKWRDLEHLNISAVLDAVLTTPQAPGTKHQAQSTSPHPPTQPPTNYQLPTNQLPTNQLPTNQLPPPSRRELDRLAPTRMEVPSGSHVLIHYEGDEPTAQVKLQECFGLMETPKLAGGRIPVVMTLLSPAHRPIQVTKDLAGFWKGAYQLVRKDMRGRYPKHDWPEDPLTAVAPRRKRG